MSLRISVIGTGYLGATHAACLAELGFEVVGVDSDFEKVTLLSAGQLPFTEPGLPELLTRHVRSGRLRFTTSLREAAQFADVHFICVGTPQLRTGNGADLTAVTAVARGLAEHLSRDALIVGKSTVPVGTAQRLTRLVASLTRYGVEAPVVWNPEFLREGYAVQDTLAPDRLVFGLPDGDTTSEAVLRRVYRAPIAAGTPVHVTDLATAELAKVAANSFLATKISFINAMADVSERAGADVVALADILGDDERIGRRFLDAGVGFGGGCLPKDIRAFSARASELGATGAARLLDDVDAINLRARQRTVDAALEMCGSLRRRRVAVLGAAFKPLSDDVRDSPALAVASQLHLRGADVRVFDPEANHNAKDASPFLTYADSVAAVLDGADLVMHLTEWPQFRGIDPESAAELVRTPRLVDGRNKLDHERWRAAGWTVRGLGRSDTTSHDQGWLAATGTTDVRPMGAGRLRGLLSRQ